MLNGRLFLRASWSRAATKAENVEEVGLRHGKDAAIWEYALRRQAVIFTKDEDFVGRYRRQSGGPVNRLVAHRKCGERSVACLAHADPARRSGSDPERGSSH
jgi:predicted nuclease of predicted toxin-antitoxin system